MFPEPIFKIRCSGVDFWSTDFLVPVTYKTESVITFAIPEIPVVDEMLFVFFHKSKFKREKVFQFWLHTAFIKVSKAVVLLTAAAVRSRFVVRPINCRTIASSCRRTRSTRP